MSAYIKTDQTANGNKFDGRQGTRQKAWPAQSPAAEGLHAQCDIPIKSFIS